MKLLFDEIEINLIQTSSTTLGVYQTHRVEVFGIEIQDYCFFFQLEDRDV